VWADYIKREKNAINVIGAIARKNLRMEVFSRIRLAAREKFLDQNAERILTNFARMMKQGVVRKAYGKWRRAAYKKLIKEMENKQAMFELTKDKQKDEMERM
jgi:hypothetical protein